MNNQLDINKLISELNNADNETAETLIEKISEMGDNTIILPLAQFLLESKNELIKKMIFNLFSDLKQNSTVQPLVEIIFDNKFATLHSEIIACCWNNGLDYSKYLSQFVDLVIESDFELALESFTLIENMWGKIDKNVEIKELEKIDKALNIKGVKNKYFLEELLRIIPNIPEFRTFYEC